MKKFRFPTIHRPDISARDAHAYGGIMVAALGGWQISVPWTCVGVGLVLLGMGLFLARRRAS